MERGKGHAPQGAWPPAPEELLQLQWESDRIRAQATRPGEEGKVGGWLGFLNRSKVVDIVLLVAQRRE